jgi:hypothetical protein
MFIPEDNPFAIEMGEQEITIHIAEICDHARDQIWIKTLYDLIHQKNRIVCDFKQNRSILISWLRIIDNLAQTADKFGTKVIVVNAEESTQEMCKLLQVNLQFEN